MINPSLNTRFPGGPKGVDGLSSGHPNLNGSYPCLLKDFHRGILIIEMLPASLQPKEVEDEAAKDVKWLSDVGEALYMVPLDPRRVIFSLEDGFTQHDEWPRESDVIGRSPFMPDIIEGLSSLFGEGTLEKTMLKGFGGLLRANLARGEDPHALQPRAYREAPFRVSHMKVPTFRGRELCQILAITCVAVEF
jgi:hypothetical protein